ncbi:MAG: phosphotransferase family protein [Alphaproteobacteria bacterium]|nr:phosphotransferase family protein [Alphaproteobacteria bacterium]
MSASQPDFAPLLERAVARAIDGVQSIVNLKRLSGGASQETWSLDGVGPKGTTPLILRRAPGGKVIPRSATAVSLATEAKAIRLAAAGGVPVPPVPYVLQDSDDLGPGYLMGRVEGETIARKILRDAAFADARPKLARQCGRILAGIHAIDKAQMPELAVVPPRAQFDQYRTIYDTYDYPHPVFEVAFKWLEQRLPSAPELTLVHGDFRHGNLMIGPDGVRAVLDWELTHIGDPAEDLGWICVNSWRFGETHKVVGGFGDVEDLLAGYAEAGGKGMTAERVKFWEMFGTLKWGIMCMTMYQSFATGSDRSVERATIGRRSSETEIDLVNLLFEKRG